MSINVSVLNRSIRPRKRSLTRGWLTCRIPAASACVKPRAVMSSCSRIMRSERIIKWAASLEEKPTSRKTLPFDLVTSRFRLCGILDTFPPKQITKSASRKPQFVFGCFSASLLKRMKNVNGLGKPGYIEYPVFHTGSNSDLSHAAANVTYGFSIVRIKSLLHPAELKPEKSARVSGERFHIVTRRSAPENRFIRHVSICKYSYILSSALSLPTVFRLPDLGEVARLTV